RGAVEFGGEDVTKRSTSYRIRQGMAIVPENRRLFAPMTVRENLEMGAYLLGRARKEDFERVYTLFPLLHERRSQLAGTLSGGEQQMVAMGRALMSRPKLLLMDEPSMGLAPILVERSFQIIQQVHAAGVAMLVVEQNANMALSIADRGYVLSTGRLVLEGPAAVLLQHEDLRKAYLGRGDGDGRGPLPSPLSDLRAAGLHQLLFAGSTVGLGPVSVRAVPRRLGRERRSVGVLDRTPGGGASGFRRSRQRGLGRDRRHDFAVRGSECAGKRP